MFTASIGTAETSLFIGGAASRSAEISYAADRPVAIWYRHNFYVWIRLVLDRTGLPCRAGSFRSPALQAGDVLEYRLYLDPAHNPGATTAKAPVMPHDAITLLGLRPEPTRHPWPRHAGLEMLGTNCCRRLGSPGRMTHVLLEAARQEPRRDAQGALTFAAPEFSCLSLNRQRHRIDLGGLIPGADYNLIIRHSNAAGEWFTERDTLTIPARPVKTATFAGTRRLSAVPSNR
jgi:hypothetical protein